MEDYISAYLDYVKDTEPPVFFHRWCAITSLGAWLGRRYFLDHGHFTINPNIYTMLMGSPGTRKSTAIKISRKLLTLAGYNTFSADKTSKEKFILDLSGETDDTGTAGYRNKRDSQSEMDKFLSTSLWGDGEDEIASRPDAETFIVADEFNDFLGNGNIEFISLLGSFWDFQGIYSNRIKSGKSVSINNPTVSILSGNTPKGFSLAFPTDILGQGFFSRLLLIHSDPSGRKITFPKKPADSDTLALVSSLHSISQQCAGRAEISRTAELLLEKIYQRAVEVSDVRFESYFTRRFSHLLKLCLVVSAARGSNKIVEHDIVLANTILTHTERFMPKALGEFGRARHSEVSHKILQIIESNQSPSTFTDIWKHVSTDLEKMSDLVTLLQNLTSAGKIQSIPGSMGFLPKKAMLSMEGDDVVDFSLLTPEEREMKK